MKFKIQTNTDTSTVSMFINQEFNALEPATLLETIRQAREEIIKKCAEEVVNIHLQEVIASIDVKSLVNAVYIQSAKRMSEELINNQKEK